MVTNWHGASLLFVSVWMDWIAKPEGGGYGVLMANWTPENVHLECQGRPLWEKHQKPEVFAGEVSGGMPGKRKTDSLARAFTWPPSTATSTSKHHHTWSIIHCAYLQVSQDGTHFVVFLRT
jgi:hypothetical protein